MTFAGPEQKLLEKIHRTFLEIEKKSRDGHFPEDLLKELKDLLTECQSSNRPEIARLALIPAHLNPQMTLKHFVGFLVPVERLLQKKLRDDEFLITTLDKAQPVTVKAPLILVLDNIRSAFNVGSIFRTAECLNIEAIYLCGYTPTPEQAQITKTAMGTEDFLPWKSFSRLTDALAELKKQGYRVVALETAEKSVDLYDSFKKAPTAFVFGNERFGLEAETLSLADEVRTIPLRGQKNSLNVGVTAAVAGFEWIRQWNQKN